MRYIMKNCKCTDKVVAQITSVNYIKENNTYKIEFLGKNNEDNFTEEGTAFFSKQELEKLVYKSKLKCAFDIVGRTLVLSSPNKTKNVKKKSTPLNVFSLNDGIYTGAISNIYKLNDETYQLDLKFGKKLLTTFVSSDEIRKFPFSALFRILDTDCVSDLIGHTVEITVKNETFTGSRDRNFRIVKYDVVR